MPHLETEEELEQYIFDSFGNEFEWDYFDGDVLLRQLNISGYGAADLVKVSISHDFNGRENTPLICITIIELKKGVLKMDAVGQISRYRTGISRVLEKISERNGKKLFKYEVDGILVGSEYDSGDVCYAVDNMDWLNFYNFDISLSDGISFTHQEGWYSTKEKETIGIDERVFNEFIKLTRYCSRQNRKLNKENA